MIRVERDNRRQRPWTGVRDRAPGTTERKRADHAPTLVSVGQVRRAVASHTAARGAGFPCASARAPANRPSTGRTRPRGGHRYAAWRRCTWTYQPDLAVPGAVEAVHAFVALAVASGLRRAGPAVGPRRGRSPACRAGRDGLGRRLDDPALQLVQPELQWSTTRANPVLSGRSCCRSRGRSGAVHRCR